MVLSSKVRRFAWVSICVGGALMGASASGAFAAAGASPSQTGGGKAETTSPGPAGKQGSTDLSEQLNKSRGVIAPPSNVDPQMQVNPPDTAAGKMPVIPPPGSPGGDPNVVPK